MIPALKQFNLYGETLFRLRADKPVRESMSINRLTQWWQTPSATQWIDGDIPDGWPNMRVVRAEPDEEIENQAYELKLECEGILGPETFILLDRVDVSQEEGFNEIACTVYTRNPSDARWAKGSKLSMDPLRGVSCAANGVMTKPSHGLVTGQSGVVHYDEANGFANLSPGTRYWFVVIDAHTFRLATSGVNAAAETTISPGVGIGAVIETEVQGLEYMWVNERRDRAARARGYYEIDLVLKGLLDINGNTSLVKRSGNTTAQTISAEKYTALHIHTLLANYPPQSVGNVTQLFDGAAVEADLPQISVTDRFISTSPPPTSLVPQHWIPPNAPAVGLFPLHPGGIQNAAPLYHLPWGWKVLSLAWDEFPGKSMYFITLTWGYQTAYTITSKSE